MAIYDTHHANSGLDPDGGRWATVCEEHGGVINHETLALARLFAPVPDQWCEGCMEGT